MRVCVAILTGYLIFAISTTLWFQLTGHDPRAQPTLVFGVFSVVYGMLFAAAGGYTAARLSQRPGVLPAVIVGLIIAAIAVVSMLTEPKQASIWTEWATVLLMTPAAYAGGVISRRTGKPGSDTSAAAPGRVSSP